MALRDSTLEILERLVLLLRAFHRAQAALHVRNLLRRLRGLSDARMRALVVRDTLASLSVGTSAEVIQLLYSLGEAERDLSQAVLVDLVASDEVRKGLPPAFLKALVREMQRRSHNEAARLLVSEPEGLTFERDLEVVPRPTEPVGWRIAMARKPSVRQIERLLYDPDPRVVRTMLGNPRLTEGDVLKIASSRRSSPEVLEAIAHDPRWIARYPVKVALVYNGHTPARIALGLLPSLLQQDLREVAGAAGVPADVRARARRLVDQQDAYRTARLAAEG